MVGFDRGDVRVDGGVEFEVDGRRGGEQASEAFDPPLTGNLESPRDASARVLVQEQRTGQSEAAGHVHCPEQGSCRRARERGWRYPEKEVQNEN